MSSADRHRNGVKVAPVIPSNGQRIQKVNNHIDTSDSINNCA